MPQPNAPLNPPGISPLPAFFYAHLLGQEVREILSAGHYGPNGPYGTGHHGPDGPCALPSLHVARSEGPVVLELVRPGPTQ